jgi:hypothetical protein
VFGLYTSWMPLLPGPGSASWAQPWRVDEMTANPRDALQMVYRNGRSPPNPRSIMIPVWKRTEMVLLTAPVIAREASNYRTAGARADDLARDRRRIV